MDVAKRATSWSKREKEKKKKRKKLARATLVNNSGHFKTLRQQPGAAVEQPNQAKAKQRATTEKTTTTKTPATNALDRCRPIQASELGGESKEPTSELEKTSSGSSTKDHKQTTTTSSGSGGTSDKAK